MCLLGISSVDALTHTGHTACGWLTWRPSVVLWARMPATRPAAVACLVVNRVSRLPTDQWSTAMRMWVNCRQRVLPQLAAGSTLWHAPPRRLQLGACASVEQPREVCVPGVCSVLCTRVHAGFCTASGSTQLDTCCVTPVTTPYHHMRLHHTCRAVPLMLLYSSSNSIHCCRCCTLTSAGLSRAPATGAAPALRPAVRVSATPGAQPGTAGDWSAV